jgi:hypothetical protein
MGDHLPESERALDAIVAYILALAQDDGSEPPRIYGHEIDAHKEDALGALDELVRAALRIPVMDMDSAEVMRALT